MISNKIPTFEAIKTFANKVKYYIDNIHIFQSYIKIKNEEDNKELIIYPDKIYSIDDNNLTIQVDFNQSNTDNEININNTRLSGLAEPVNDTDAVPKSYFDNIKVTPVKIACTFNTFLNNTIRRITTFNNLDDLVIRYKQGQRIQINGICTMQDLEFNIVTFIENYDSDKHCFYAPLFYYKEDENKILEGIIKIYENNQRILSADFIAQS